MRIMGLVAAGVAAALATAGAALAQTGPVAPGAELLPADLRRLAETPLVLTTEAAPTFCLEMSDRDAQARTVQAATCAARWNQKVWFEMLPVQGNGERVRIRIGKLACLLPGGQAGARATMGICNDAPEAEPWTWRNGQLVSFSGFCLAMPSPAEGAAVLSESCNAASPDQQWRLEAMRTALSRMPAGRMDPSGFGEYFYMGYIADVVEKFRPRFTSRALTPAERRELRVLASSWGKVKPFDALRGKMGQGQKVPPIHLPWSTLKRLSELGESGDKEAMRAAMEAFSLVRDTNWSDTFAGWDETAFPHADDSQLAHGVAEALAGIWSAHYWQRFGPDRLAGYPLAYCRNFRTAANAFICMGYTVDLAQVKPTGDMMKWVGTGEAKYAMTMRSISFQPAGGTPGERRARFVSVMDGSAFTTVADEQRFDQEDRAQQAVYAEQIGRLPLWDNVMLNRSFDYPNFTSQQELYMRQTLKARAEASAWRAKFEAFMSSPSEAQIWSIQQGLRTASDADILRFAERHVVMDEELSARLCGSGREATPACQRSRQGIAARRAEYDAAIAQARAKRAAEDAAQFAAQQAREQAQIERDRQNVANARKPDFWDQLAGLAEGFADAAEAGNQMVTVRTYDSAGNFIGTETMTRSRAMGLGAQTDN